MKRFEVRPFGDRALLIELEGLDDVLALQAELAERPLPGQSEVIAAATTVLLRADSPAAARRLTERLRAGLPATSGASGTGRLVEIDVVYDGDDLAEVARLTGLSPEGVVAAHTGTEWTGAFGGFAPGFTYLGGGDPRLSVPRLDSPRTAVPAGSVALAGEYSAVYPRESPGGWQLIGRTDAILWDLGREQPALIAPLDRVRFRAATERLTLTSSTSDAADAGPEAPGATAEAGLEVLDPGLQSLVQDLGRPGQAALGVPASGAADRPAAAQANRLLGNPAADAVVEILLSRSRFRAVGDQVLALTGATADAVITAAASDERRRERPAPFGAPFALLDGETLILSPATAGLRTYLGLRGGVAAESTLGSRATDSLSGLGPAPLTAGTLLPRLASPGLRPVGSPEPGTLRLPDPHDDAATLRFVPGPRADWFGDEELARFSDQTWTVGSDSNRVGVRLQITDSGDGAPGPLVRHREGELASEPMVAGALQVPPSGLPVLFLADHPVTGGYPVIGTVLGEDFSVAAQLPPGSRIRFRAVAADADPAEDSEPPSSAAPTTPKTPAERNTVLKKVLIANRGEIAVRMARACADAGLKSVAVYSDPDADALHVRRADEAYPLSGTSGADTYLNIEKVLDAARRSGADAVHPGYGFLSENADFAQAVIDAGLAWIGPDPETIRALGNKVTARDIAVAAGAPLVPGSDGPVETADAARAFAEEHGLPVIIKAAHGGGGRGMRIARELGEVEEAFASAVREAEVAFGRGECFVERFLDKPRHVEAQVLADRHGNVVVVGTRDCSLQRRNQKLVEEAPAPFLTDDQRSRIHEAAREICRTAGYTGAGTVEFLVAPDGLISFLEVNTRLQVEHPITEETTGVDLVAEQFRIAAGEPLSLTEDPAPRGHAFEFRINAEDPARGFLPAPGDVTRFDVPTGAGVRVDTGVRTGSSVPAAYDSLMAKLIVVGATREQALVRARAALDEFEIEGVPSVLPFHRAVVADAAFTGSEAFGVYTTWIEDAFQPGDFAVEGSEDIALPARDGRRERITVDIDGKGVQVGVPADLLSALRAGGGAPSGTAAEEHDDGAAEALASPVEGNLVKWVAEDGARIEAGDPVAIVEAMKMESPVPAHRNGVFARGDQEPGQAVKRGEALGRIDG